MKINIIITIVLFIISFILIKVGVYIIKDNDKLMNELKDKQSIYNIKPTNAIITNQTMIPGISGKMINLDKSYQKMKSINEFKESLLVYDVIKPDITINNIFDKVIIKGNPNINKVSLLTNLDNKYCYTEDLTIKKECIQSNKYTILIYKINNNYLSNIKDIISNGKIIYLDSIKEDELNLINKYLKSNNYEIVNLDDLIKE